MPVNLASYVIVGLHFTLGFDHVGPCHPWVRSCAPISPLGWIMCDLILGLPMIGYRLSSPTVALRVSMYCFTGYELTSITLPIVIDSRTEVGDHEVLHGDCLTTLACYSFIYCYW